MLGKIKRVIWKTIRILNFVFCRMIPCDKKTVLFLSFHGRGYSDNPKALYEYIHSNYSELKCVWAIRRGQLQNVKIEGAKIIPYFSLSYFFYLARAKYWVINCKLPQYVSKKKKQVYLQTWHGTPLKRLAHDIVLDDKNITFYRSKMSAQQMYKTYDDDVARYNYMISPNPFSTEVFMSAFQINRERLIETGYPRNDVLLQTSPEEVEKLKEQMGLPKDKKVILYAPTWRDNSFVTAGYTFRLEVDFDKWKETLGEEYVVIFKPHYLIISDFDVKKWEGFVYEVDASNDIASLYLVSDILVTDYSSVFFDYAILNRPMYFYMFDLEEYANELRGFYFDIHETLPGPIVQTESDLLEHLSQQTFNYDRLEAFNQKFNQWHDGRSSEKVCNILFGENEA